MNELLLKELFAQTPRMEPQDAVKLAFQSAFGCGHLLPARELTLRMIENELSRVPAADVPAATPIGNGLCRLNLAAPGVRALGAEILCRMMQLTEQAVSARGGNEQRFSSCLSLIATLADRGEAPFSAAAFRAYLDQYERNVVSHTQAYRDAYAPAYRVVLAEYALLLPVIRQILQGRRLIVVDGPCGSGKTTLAGRLGELFSVTPIPMDDFFLPPPMRTPERLAEPGGNVHRERFQDEVLSSLMAGGAVKWQRFDCQTGRMLDRELPAGSVAIIEGSYSHHPFFAQAYAQLDAWRVFISVDEDEQLRRIGKRDPEMLSMFQNRWIPLEKTYFEAYDIRRSADCVMESPRLHAH